MNRDEALAIQTFKDSGMTTSHRVLEVLLQNERNQAKLIGVLIAKLEEKGLLTDTDIDDMLLDVA